MKKITSVAQDILFRLENKKVAIDFTCGNGNDTFRLAHHFDKVYAFDIQEEAVEMTKNQCRFLNNVDVIHDSHHHFMKYVNGFNAGIFNLGYLPGGDEEVTTSASVVIQTLKQALLRLKSEGSIVLVLYPGYEHGFKESEEVEEYCSTLNGKDYDVSKIQLLNRENAPYIIRIDKH